MRDLSPAAKEKLCSQNREREARWNRDQNTYLASTSKEKGNATRKRTSQAVS